MLSDACFNLLECLTDGQSGPDVLGDFRNSLAHYGRADNPLRYAPEIFPVLSRMVNLFESGSITAVAVARICIATMDYYDNAKDVPISRLIERIQVLLPDA